MAVKHLAPETLALISAYIDTQLALEGKPPHKQTEIVPWPDNAPYQFNACTDPCDAFCGPCCCGAWHKDGR